MGESRRRRDFGQLSPGERLGDAPVVEEYHARMTAVMQSLDEFMNGDSKGSNRKVGIVVMMFPYGEVTGRCNYMSNGADRKDMVRLMKEMIKKFERQPEQAGKE